MRQIPQDMKGISDSLHCEFMQIVGACGSKDQTTIEDASTRLAKVATHHFHAAFEFCYRKVDREGPSQLLICVGAELLLNALAILLTPEAYVQACGSKVRPPGFNKVYGCVNRILTNRFSVRQKHHFSDVLGIIQEKRNIFAHMSLSFHAKYYQHYEILNVLLYLLQTYFPSLREEIAFLSIMKEKFRMKNAVSCDYIDFSEVEPCQQGTSADAKKRRD